MADEPKRGGTSTEELDKLIAKGKQKGFLTYDEVNDALPSDVVSPRPARRHHDDVRLHGHRGRGLGQGRPPALRDRGAQPEAEADDDEARAAPHRPHAGPRRPHRGSRCASTCARWAGSRSSPARARSRSPSASRRARTRPPRAILVHQPRHRARSARLRDELRKDAASRSRTWWTTPRRSPPRRRRRSCAAR